MKNTPYAYSQMEKNSNQPSQSHYYSHFYFKPKQTYADYAILAAKRTEEALRQIFKAIITIWWKHLTDNNNQKNKNKKPLQSRIITLNEEDPPHRYQDISSEFRR